jgi:hypothetical protein
MHSVSEGRFSGIGFAIYINRDQYSQGDSLMEIRFRPLPASKLARQASPGQAPTEDGQSFVEVVESLTAADQTPEKDANAGGNREQRSRNRPPGSAHESIENTAEMPTDQKTESAADSPDSQSPDKADPPYEPVGARLDLTA